MTARESENDGADNLTQRRKSWNDGEEISTNN